MDSHKLGVKDLINVGIFSAVYLAVMIVVVTVLGTIPVLYAIAPIPVAIICGTIYLLLVLRAPKTGSVLIMSIIMVFLFLGAGWYAAVWSVLMGLIVELMLLKGGYQSLKRIKLSYMVFSLTTVGPYLGVALVRQQYLDRVYEYYGQDYTQALDRFLPPWIVLPLLVGTALAALVGVAIGGRILKKHFAKAGIV